MSRSNAAVGAYYKARTRKWLAAHGFLVWDMETIRFVGFPQRVPIKRDQCGADLGAMKTGVGVVLVQVKGGAQAKGGTFPEARREFLRHPVIDAVHLVIVAWVPRARTPRVIDGRTGADLKGWPS